MPVLPSPGKVLRFDFFQTLGDDVHCLNSLFMSYTGTSSASDQANITEAAENGWETEILSEQVNDNVLQEVVCTDLLTTSSPRTTVTSGVAGSISGGAMGASTAMVFSRQIARRFRGGHSRMYLGGMPQGQLQDPQHWSGSIIITMTGRYAALIAAITGSSHTTLGTLQEVQVSYFEGFTVVTNPITHRARNVPTLRATPLVEPVTSVTASAKVASQRRRNLQST